MSNPGGTMRAMRASASDPASLSLDRVPIPQAGPGEVLVRVAATAITAQELTWPESWPVIPCHDLSGVVAGSGPGSPGGTSWPDGTEVFGLVGFDRPGAAAEYVTIPAADLAAKPASIDHVAAAAIPLGGLTAWQALHDHADLQPGQHVLVHGGAGGVGAYAVQVAVALGAQVTATASARDAAYVADLGAHQVIDYKGRFEEEVRDVDVVVDPVGGDTMARSWSVLKPGGILVAIAEEPPADHGGRDDVRGVFFVVEPSGEQLSQLAKLVDDGKLRAAVSTTFGLADLREAFAGQQHRSHPGKVVITVP
ncbi:MAG: NADP-dependent oxidoreductase [Streptosporangiaceae bacterium]|jgi:NADPH:quinone reductase-like Zn-dependent oxidoreductase